MKAGTGSPGLSQTKIQSHKMVVCVLSKLILWITTRFQSIRTGLSTIHNKYCSSSLLNGIPFAKKICELPQLVFHVTTYIFKICFVSVRYESRKWFTLILLFSASLSKPSEHSAHDTERSPGQSVCVCRSTVYCGKMADWIRMLFGMVSGVGWGWVY